MNLICDIPIAECVGRGTGLDDAGMNHKATILGQAIDFHKERWATENIEPSALDFLSAVGGFEITQMVGGMIQAASQKAAILVDGFISTAAFLVAAQIQPAIKEYAIFTHQSNEKGHRMMLESLEAKPLLDIGMRLGEGSGAAVAYPLLVSATAFLSEMASFESAGVSEAG